MDENAIVTFNGAVMIPNRLRRKYNIKPGTRLQFSDEGGEIRVTLAEEPIQPSIIYLKNAIKGKVAVSLKN